MADTLIRLRWDPNAGVETQIEDEQGRVYDRTLGLFVPLSVADWPRYDLDTPETPAGSGRYMLDFATLGVGGGVYSWTHFARTAGTAAPGRPVVGYGERFWDGATFSPAPPASTTYDGLAAFGVVLDPNPSDRSFVVALNGGASVPDDGDWVQLFACFTSGANATAKRQITGYRKVTDFTGLVTVGSSFPAAPASGDALTIL